MQLLGFRIVALNVLKEQAHVLLVLVVHALRDPTPNVGLGNLRTDGWGSEIGQDKNQSNTRNRHHQATYTKDSGQLLRTQQKRPVDFGELACHRAGR